MKYFGYDFSGNEQYRFLAMVDDSGIVCDIIDIIKKKFSLLNDGTLIKLELVNDVLDLHVIDSDDLILLPQYAIFEKLRDNNEIHMITQVSDNDTENARKFIFQFEAFVKKHQSMLPSLEEINRIFAQRYQFDRRNVNSDFIKKNADILLIDSVLNNCNDETRMFINDLVKTLPIFKARFENRPVTSENQKIFFNATPTSVMPSVEEVAELNIDTIDAYRLKDLVPHYTDLIGGFVNFRKSNEYNGFGYYTNGDYIRNGDTANLLNSVNYRDILTGKSNVPQSAYKQTSIDGRKIDITEKYITGDSDYDNDGIRDNEIDYFNVLKEFIDKCIQYDLENSSIYDWKKCGLRAGGNIDKFGANVNQSFLSTSFVTFEMVDPNSPDAFYLEKLYEFGITPEVIKKECVGTPTANKWFNYAINLALMATRAYTGYVKPPFGYDMYEFSDKIPASRNSIDIKIKQYLEGNIFYRNGWIESSLYDQRMDGESDDAVYFNDYMSLNSEYEVVDRYWDNLSIATDNENSKIIQYASNELLEAVVGYCMRSNSFYALAEALIKCLRFGMKKPRCLQLLGMQSKVDLTTTSLKMDVSRDNPVPLSSTDSNKVLLLNTIVTVNSKNISSNLMSSNKIKFSSMSGEIIVGVGLSGQYDQENGDRESIIDYYDIETFLNNEDIHDKVINFRDGKFIELSNFTSSNIKRETVQDVISNLISNSSTTSVVMNDNVYTNVINYYLSKSSTKHAKKVISGLNRKGFNLFTSFSNLMRVSNVTINMKLIAIGKDVVKIDSERDSDIIEDVMITKILSLYGGLLNNLIDLKSSENLLDDLNNSLIVWSNHELYGLDMSDSDVHPSDVSLQTYYDMVSHNIPKSDYLLIVVTHNNSGLFYCLQKCVIINNKPVLKGQYLTLSFSKLSKDEVMRIAGIKSAGMVKNVKFELLVNKIKASINKNNVSVDVMINKLFMFFDDDTKNIVINMIHNSIGR